MDEDARPWRIDLARGRLGLGGIAAVDNDRTALRDEPGRGLFAHARTTAGDDRYLILEPHNHLHLPTDRFDERQISLELWHVKIYLSIDRVGVGGEWENCRKIDGSRGGSYSQCRIWRLQLSRPRR